MKTLAEELEEQTSEKIAIQEAQLVSFYTFKAGILIGRGQRPQARELVQKALTIFPDSKEMQEILASLEG